MANEMIERVKAAILPAFDHIEDKAYRSVIAGCWARAAIEAMMEPGGYKEAMVQAGGEVVHDNRQDMGILSVDLARSVWQAMLSAALNEQPRPVDPGIPILKYRDATDDVLGKL